MTIYDQLLQFPLFQGMSHADLMEVVTHTRLGFLKVPAGKRIVKEGEPCTHLYFLISGTVLCETWSDDRHCRVEEVLKAPYVLQPANLFGISQRYTTTFRAQDPCHFITIDKQETFLLLEAHLVFRLNLINLMATDAQRLRHQAWRPAPTTLTERLARYFLSRCLYPAGPKTFYVLMNQVAADLNDSRLDISRALNQMQAEGLVILRRGRIEIPLLERLLM